MDFFIRGPLISNYLHVTFPSIGTELEISKICNIKKKKKFGFYKYSKSGRNENYSIFDLANGSGMK